MSLVAGSPHGPLEAHSPLAAPRPLKSLFLTCVACAFAMPLFVAAPASAQEFRWVRGRTVAVTADTLTILVAGPNLNITFAVDQASWLHPGRDLTWEGPPEQRRPTLRQAVRVGDLVDVHYLQQASRNYAAIVRSPSGGSLVAGTSMTGVVTAISAEHVTLEADGHGETFDVEHSTRIVARERRGASLLDYIGREDLVLVTYRLEDSRRVALEIVSLRRHESR